MAAAYTDDDGAAIIDRAECISETRAALLVRFADPPRSTVTIWIPKSVVHDDSEVFDAGRNARGRLVLLAWWAEREGLTS